MDYSTDRPINKSEEDLLGRASFSKYLGEAIYKYKGSDGLVIGLFGKWGTGKTSIINMAKEEIEKQSENDENRPIIMDFSPWNYSDKNDLISLFFQSLKSKFDLEKNEKLEKDFGEALSNYAEAFELLSIVPMFGSGLAKLLKIIAKSEGNNLMKIPDLDSTKKKLEEKLRDSEQKIIIVIDDIDRLTNPQIRDIFQLVKQVANFPNIIYILSMDRDVVSRALEEVHKIDGNQYLEKIIQLPFEIPELKKYKLDKIFFLKLNKIRKESYYDIYNEGYWMNIRNRCIKPYIKTLRDVNRVINTFKFRYGMLYREILFEDMIAITIIEVLEPKLYKWIYNNKSLLCGGLYNKRPEHIDIEESRKKIKDEFNKLEIDAEKAVEFIDIVFPMIYESDSGFNICFEAFFEGKGRFRVAYEDRFDLYFTPDLDDIYFFERTINQFVYNDDFNNLKKTINKLIKNNDIFSFIDNISSKIDEIPYERIGIIASALLCIVEELKEEIDIYPNISSIYNKVTDCIYNIIKCLKTTDERFNFIKNTLKDISKFGLALMAGIIEKIEIINTRIKSSDGDSTEEFENLIISIVELQEIKKLYVNKINDIVYSDSISEIPEFNSAFMLWKRLDKDGAKNYISYIFKDNVQKLRFICSIAERRRYTVENSWVFNSNQYGDLISYEDIYNLIKEFGKKNLDKFSELEQIKLATFVLNYGKDDRIYGVNEEQAAKLVEEWKQSQ